MTETVKIKTEGKYFNHSVKQNKAIDVTFKLPYTELRNYIGTIQMLNENVMIAGKIGADKKPIKLGTFMVHNISVDRDGQGTLKFNSMLDHVDANAINDLASRNDEPLMILLKADIELEEEDESEQEVEVEA